MKESFFHKYKKDILNLAILLILILFILWNTFNNAFIGGTNDLEMQSYHLWYLKDSLVKYGSIPTWTSDLFGGKPYLGLYQPGSFFLLLPISLIFGGILTPKIAILTISLLSMLFFYLLAKKLFKNNLFILLSTALFTVFPNRLAMTNGGTLAELTAVTFVPLAFYIYEKTKEDYKLRNLALLGLVQGLALLTHHAVGGSLLFALLLFTAYDHFMENKKEIVKVIPFLILGILISLVFLIPAYQIQKTLNFAVIEQSGQLFRPLTLNSLFIRAESRGGGEFLGIIAGIVLLFSIPLLLRKDIFTKYIAATFIFLALGLFLYFLIPAFIKGTLQGAHRFFSVLSVTFTISVVLGIEKLANYLTSATEKYELISIKKNKEKTKNILNLGIIIIIFLLIFLSHIQFRPQKGNDLVIPNNVLKFYSEVAKDKEYYRIEDQQFSPFGFTPILHRHGILNGAPMQEAPKYHFFFWNEAWKLLQTPIGQANFAGLYGTLSIKYFLSGSQMNIPNFKEVECGYGYCINENEKFLPYVRIVPNVLKINVQEPEHFVIFLDYLKKQFVPFDKVAFVHADIGSDEVKLTTTNTKVELLEKKPGYIKANINNLNGQEYLVIAESYHPYWKAFQNNKELNVYEGIPSTLIIPVKENGMVEVKFEQTKLKKFLFVISIITILILIGLIIYDYKKSKK